MPTLATTFGTLQRSRSGARAARRSRAVAAGDVPSETAAALRAMGLLATGEPSSCVRLSDGADALVLRAELRWGTVCLKHVAPGEPPEAAQCAERVDAEARWLKLAQTAVPGCTPTVHGSLPSGGWLALEHLDAAEFPAWQRRLAGGRVEPWVAAELGHLVGRLHAAAARSAAIERYLPSHRAFQRLRLAPAFDRVAAAYPECAPQLERLAGTLAATRLAAVHGDLVPENVLNGPRGPVLIDADCAHYGDPAVDVATLLAALWTRMATHCRLRAEYAGCWDAFHRSYAAHVTWEMPEGLEARAAALVPALGLGALESAPLAGLGGAVQRARTAACDFVATPPAGLGALRDAWLDVLEGD
jgi:aminoglycoside phosphotransferase (APT) family kinase protein